MILAENSGKGWTPLLLMTCLATTIGLSVSVGYFLGVLNTPAEYIKAWCYDSLLSRYNWHVSESEMEILWASVVSIFLVGGIVGSFFGAWFSDRFGRKGTLNISASILVISGFLFNFCREANSVEMLLLGRLLGGIASALVYTAHPMYLLEIASPQLKNTVGVFTAVGVTGGIVVGQVFSLEQVLGGESLWHFALSFYALILIVCFLPVYWFPESPRWLYLVRHDVKAARVELKRLRGRGSDDLVYAEISELETYSKAVTSTRSMGSVLKDRELLLPLVIVCAFQLCQQLSGINAIFFYSIPIFTKAGFSTEMAAWMNLGAGCLNLLISSLGPFLMAKFNRRPLMLMSCITCFIAHIGLAFSLNYIDYLDWLPTACIILLCSFIFFFQFGLGPIPYFIGSELFEDSPRPVAMSMGSLLSWTGNFMIGMFFPLMQGAWGSFAFLPCAVVCLLAFTLTWFYLPESRGRDPADLKVIMKDGFKSKVK